MAEPSGHDTADRQDSRRSVEQLPEGTTDVEDLLQRRVSLRIRALQGLGLLVVLVVVVSVIGRSLQAPLNHAPAVVPTSTPVSLGPVLVLSNVSFGTVTVNGTLLSGPPPLVTSFRRGLNTMTLTAPPFHPQTCQVQWPSGQVQPPSDQYPPSCDLRRDVSAPYHVGGRSVTPVALVELWLSGDDLPAAVRERTLANISATLRAVPLRTTVPAGEYVATGLDADGRITSQRVATPLQADLVVTPDSPGSYGDQFCQDSGCVPLPAAATASWAVGISVSDQWQFSSPSGGQVLRSALSPPAWFLRLVLTADPVNGWDVDQQRTEQLNGFGLPFALPATVCQAGADVLSTRVTPNPTPGPPSPQQYSPSVVYDHELAGCELRLTNASGASGGSFIWRFGVLLAADAQAQALMPDLPLAPPSALAAVGASSLAQP